MTNPFPSALLAAKRDFTAQSASTTHQFVTIELCSHDKLFNTVPLQFPRLNEVTFQYASGAIREDRKACQHRQVREQAACILMPPACKVTAKLFTHDEPDHHVFNRRVGAHERGYRKYIGSIDWLTSRKHWSAGCRDNRGAVLGEKRPDR